MMKVHIFSNLILYKQVILLFFNVRPKANSNEEVKSELKLITIDEISMFFFISCNTTLLHIHQRLKEIFGTVTSQLFTGISIITVGDTYQLQPIGRKPVFANFKNDVFNLCYPLHLFTMTELVEIMRQKDDEPFAEHLNRY